MKNDQEELIELIKQHDYNQAWQHVKAVGYKTVPDVQERFLIYNTAVRKFDPTMNNNFILFYKNALNRSRFNKYSTYYVTSDKDMINRIKRQATSPEKLPDQSIINVLINWR